MHDTAFQGAKSFFDTYAVTFLRSGAKTKVIEIGSQDLNGSLRECCPSAFEYVGADFVAGKGVDLILEDPYSLPFETASADIIIASSCFEHSEMFWVLFLEVMRVLRPDGLFYLNVPANGDVHRHPVDCWRFYPDSGHALVAWAKRNGMNPALLESYTCIQIGDIWNDFVAVYVRDEKHVSRHPNRILATKKDFTNGTILGTEGFINSSMMPEDRRKLVCIKMIIENQVKVSIAAG